MDHRLRKHLLNIGLPIIITGIILFVFLHNISWLDFKRAFLSIPQSHLLIFLVLSISGAFLRAWKYLILLSAKISFQDIFLITLVRNFSVDLLPARSAALLFYSYLARKKGVKYEEGISSFVVSMFYDVLSLSLMLGALGLFFQGTVKRDMLYLFLGFLFAISLGCLIYAQNLLSLLLKLKIVRKTKKMALWLAHVQDYLQAHIGLGERILLLLISLLIRIVKYVSLYVLFLGVVKIKISMFSFSQFCFGLAGTELSSLLPVQGLGGFGTWELAFSLVFKSLKIPAANAFLTGLVLHVVTQVWEYSIGLCAFLYLSLEPSNGQGIEDKGRD